MTMSGFANGRVNWRWPDKDDVLDYDAKDIVQKIKPPIPLTYEYRAVAYKGAREWGDRTGDVLVCSIVSCSGPEISDCGVKYPDFQKVAPRMRFSHAKISAEFPSSQDVLTTATSLSYSLNPLSRERMHMHKWHSSARSHRNTITGLGHTKGHPDVAQGALLMMEKVQVQLKGPPADDLHTFGLYGRDYSAETGTSGSLSLGLSTKSVLLFLLSTLLIL
ncbi:vanin-like protein 2 [Ctenocephalides felis]|uniref:vanin-like protein 2 n=1 Tax=Ctenocephalides felis TaxID=7515 RepID=UPI000E6E3B80|nr:vanin-like protein 2 [Ctenocephalides felis]